MSSQVWYPVSAAVHAEDSELHRLISAPDLPPGCSLSSSWQQTPLSVTATFDSFGLDSVQVGVTDLVEFSSSNPSLVGALTFLISMYTC